MLNVADVVENADKVVAWVFAGLLALVTTMSGLILNLVVRVFKLDRAALEARMDGIEKGAAERMGRLETLLTDRLTAQDHSLTRLHDRMDALHMAGREDHDEQRKVYAEARDERRRIQAEDRDDRRRIQAEDREEHRKNHAVD